jgi:hypothetical protein
MSATRRRLPQRLAPKRKPAAAGRDAQGKPFGPLAAALDLIADDEEPR